MQLVAIKEIKLILRFNLSYGLSEEICNRIYFYHTTH
jgi:hypothetical protein